MVPDPKHFTSTPWCASTRSARRRRHRRCGAWSSAIETARRRAAEAGVADRTRFEVARETEYPRAGYDLIAFFDALHDLGDPRAAAAHARNALAGDGVCLLVEPYANERIENNLNPVGRLYYGFSKLVCTPGSLSQPGRAGLGTQAGEHTPREVLVAGVRIRSSLATQQRQKGNR
jgi:hypothetical protein